MNIIIDSRNNTNGDFIYNLSNSIYNKLKEYNVNVSLVNDNYDLSGLDNRLDKIKNKYENGIILSIANNTSISNIDLIYSLRNSSSLAEKISTSLTNNNITVNKYYQRRSESDTSLDYDYIIRNTQNYQSILIDIGNNYSSTNIDNISNGIEEGILNYLNVSISSSTSNNNDYYTVVKGDTLYSIAKKYNTTVDNLVNINNLKTNLLQIGDKLKVTGNLYTVKKGDTLYSIASSYNITVNELKTYNNLTSNILQIGQTLKIPASNTYTVKSGDTLYSIAKKNNISLDKLISYNNLSSNILSIGQKLKIPS